MSTSALPISVIGAALVLAGCTIANTPASLDPAITPVSATRHGASHVDAHYALGRYYQGQIRYEQAIESYLAVLEAQPDHAEAHNALGVIYASQGRYTAADKEFQAAIQAAPGAAHILNNFGYALMLQGRNAEAVAAFQAALRLDPAYGRATDNLRTAMARLDAVPQQSTAVAAVAPAAEPASAVVPVASAGRDNTSASVINVVTAAQVEPVMLKTDGSTVIELQRPAATPEQAVAIAPAPVSAPPTSTPAAAPTAARIEVANGNGVEGLAKRTSSYLKGAGYGPVRLTNQKPFVQTQTEIQFRPGFEAQAKGLQVALAGKGVMASSSRMRQDIQVRVVLGQDLRTTAQLAEIEAGPLRLARNGD